MTYQELIKCYPWIDLAWEIFKGISPTILGLVTVVLTEHFIKQRNLFYKKKEIQLQYLEKILAWIHDTRRKIFKANSSFAKALYIKNLEDRNAEYNKTVEMLNEMIESVFVWCDTYYDIAKSYGYDFKLQQFKDSINYYSEQINVIKSRCEDPKNAINELNAIMHIVKEAMQESINILVETISSLYGKNKKFKVKILQCVKKEKM